MKRRLGVMAVGWYVVGMGLLFWSDVQPTQRPYSHVTFEPLTPYVAAPVDARWMPVETRTP